MFKRSSTAAILMAAVLLALPALAAEKQAAAPAKPRDIRLATGQTLASLVQATGGSLVFTPLRPCRVIDTRRPGAGGRFLAGEVRSYVLRGPTTNYSGQGGNAAGCGIPGFTGTPLLENEAKALALNIIAVGPLGPGDMRAWPANQAAPLASVINYSDVGGLNIANGIILPICDEASATPCATGDVSFQAEVSGTFLVADVTGYFHAPAAADDVTAVTAGTGLTGGGAGGEVTLSLDEAFQLPQSCADGQIAVWDATALVWVCGDDASNAGDITGVAADSGLTGGGTSGDVSLSLLPAFQLPQSCADGKIGRWDVNSGLWICSDDLVNPGDVTGVAAGTGLAGGGASGDVAVSVAPSYQLPQTCGDGEVATWNAASSLWGCVSAGGVGFTKSDIYENVDSEQVAAGSTLTNTVDCNDANDIPLEGTCRPVPAGDEVVVIASEQALNWSSTTLAAQFRCVFKNQGASQFNTQTRILCVNVP
jgi:hypothetical protein